MSKFIDPVEPLQPADRAMMLDAGARSRKEFETRLLSIVRKHFSVIFPWNIEEELSEIGFGDTPVRQRQISKSPSIVADFLRILDAHESGLTLVEIEARLNAGRGEGAPSYDTWLHRRPTAQKWAKRSLVPWFETETRWLHFRVSLAYAELTIGKYVPINFHPRFAPLFRLLVAKAEYEASELYSMLPLVVTIGQPDSAVAVDTN